MAIAKAMIQLFVALGAGFLLNKKGILNARTGASVSKIILNIASPCLIFASVMGVGSEYKPDVVPLLLIGTAMYAFFSLVSFIVVKLIRTPKKSVGVFFCLVALGNVGFMGLPIAESLFGDVGMFYMGVLNVHFNLFAYTVGMILVTKEAREPQRLAVKTVVNPGTVSVVLAVILFMLDVHLPEAISGTISFVGQFTSPMAMIILGSSIATYSLKKMFCNWRYYVLAAFKLVILPLVVFFVLNAVFGTTDRTILLTIYAGCPTATIVNMMALAYGGDVENASTCTGLMTLLSVVTIPLMYVIISAL